jgi:EpsI family protein
MYRANSATGAKNDILYDQILSRTYINSRGEQIMLALAYGERQRQEYKVHRPEVCYTAQGFQIVAQNSADFGFSAPSGARVTGRQLLAHSSERFEAVSYWIRMGDIYSVNAWQARWYIFVEGLRGRVQDGILVRASQIVTQPMQAETSYATQRQFLRELTQALPSASRELLLR